MVDGVPINVTMGKYTPLTPPTYNSPFKKAYEKIDSRKQEMRELERSRVPEAIKSDLWDEIDKLEYAKEKLEQEDDRIKEEQRREWERATRISRMRLGGTTKPDLESHKYIDPTHTATPMYDNLLHEPAYFIANKDTSYDIIYMSPDEYMEGCVNNRLVMDGNTKASVRSEWQSVRPEDVKEYKKIMESGERFPMPNLDYVYGGQEGRHRAAALHLLGVKRFPVMIIRPPKEDELPPPRYVNGYSTNPAYKKWEEQTNRQFKRKYNIV